MLIVVYKVFTSEEQERTLQNEWQERIKSDHRNGWQRILNNGTYSIVAIYEIAKPRNHFFDFFVAQKAGERSNWQNPEEHQ